MNNLSINPVQASGSALREFYSSNGEQRMKAYSDFARSCQQFADNTGISFIEASQRIHSIFNINTGNK